jgi:hypothetical protein
MGEFMNLQTMSFIFGALLILIGIIGGGFEIKELKLPKVGGSIRLISIIIGSFFMAMVFFKPAKKADKPDKVDKLNKIDISDKIGKTGKIDVTDKIDMQNKESKNLIGEIDFQLRKLEEKLESIPQPPGPLHELEDIKQEHERHFEEIEGLEAELRLEIERLRPYEERDPDARHRIRILEDEKIPDLEAEKRDIQNQLERLHDEIRLSREREELEAEIHELREQRQALQKE